MTATQPNTYAVGKTKDETSAYWPEYTAECLAKLTSSEHTIINSPVFYIAAVTDEIYQY